MKRLTIALALALALPCAANAALPQPPASAHEDEESATNSVAFASAVEGNRFRLSLALDAATNNSVVVEFGVDSNCDGALGRDEVAFSVGWDCGEWVFRDRRSGAVAASERTLGRRKLEWTVVLAADGSAKSLLATDDGATVFCGDVPETFFDPTWNMVRIARRGSVAADECLDCRFSFVPFHIYMR